jgi:putative endonuclease
MSRGHIVYILRSERDNSRHYVGLTTNIATRLAAHNAGQSPHTCKHVPWRLIVALAFATEESAVSFERYLKSGAGQSFAKRHFA